MSTSHYAGFTLYTNFMHFELQGKAGYVTSICLGRDHVYDCATASTKRAHLKTIRSGIDKAIRTHMTTRDASKLFHSIFP